MRRRHIALRTRNAGDVRCTMPTAELAVKIKVVVHAAEEGGFWAEIPALPGCVTQGETVDETLANVREAAEAWLDVAQEKYAPNSRDQLVEIEL
jgi:predicted RNase H-like HicB family nuclease